MSPDYAKTEQEQLMPIRDQPDRPHVLEKNEYVPSSQYEEFIVPLLKKEIEGCLSRLGRAPSKGLRALDCGCGRQPFRKAIEQMGYAYTGIDVNQNPEKSVDIICSLDESLPETLLSKAPFDLILCTEVLEHVADWDAAFRNFSALLGNEGHLIITAPHLYQLHEEPYDFWRPTLHAFDFFGRRWQFVSTYQSAAGDAWDVLGIVLANCSFMPKRMTLRARSLAKALRSFRNVVFKTLQRRKLQQDVRIDGALYVSNIVVFVKDPTRDVGAGR